MKLLKGQKGLSLIEVTIMLLVLMLLTGVLAPSIFDFVRDAQWVKVKEDCEAIAVSIARLQRDVGCVVKDAGGSVATQLGNCLEDSWSAQHIPVVLRGDGIFVGSEHVNAGTASTFGGFGAVNWDSANYDMLAEQLITNSSASGPGPNYPYPPAGSAWPVGPAFNIGWRGAYLSTSIGPDPYGTPYLVNSAFLNVPKGGTRHNYDAFCISAGPNRYFETAFKQLGAAPAADDFITIISGGTY